MRLERRRAVGIPVLEIELVRELVEDDVLAVCRIGCPAPSCVPRQYERSQVTPRVPESIFRPFLPDSSADVPHFIGSITSRVNEDRRQLRIVVGLSVKQQQARLRRDGDANLIRQFQPTTSFEMFFREKYLYMTEQLLLILFRQSPKEGKIALENRSPDRRKGLGTQPLSPPLGKKAKDHCGNLVPVVHVPDLAAHKLDIPVPVLGLRENWRQFALLILVNAFVGAMVGLERVVLPLLAEHEFGIASKSAVLSFIATFGVVKALSNFLAGRLSDSIGRKRTLVAGWIVAIPVPLLIIWAPSWGWVVFANVLLGVNQGLTWSTTVVMKIDLVGPKLRGLAMGLNEFAGYLAVALSAFASGWIASHYGLRPEPFYLGVAFAAAGLALSTLFVRDTTAHMRLEADESAPGSTTLSMREVFVRTSWRNHALSSASQAGLVNNLNDGLAWGLFPLFFAAARLSVREIAVLAAVYPATWGIAQLWTGALSDRIGRKGFIAGGMLLQGVTLVTMVYFRGFAPWAVAGILLGVGTAMVYPTLLAAVADIAHPSWRSSAMGIYRMWRDLGYAVGALLAGAVADAFGMSAAIVLVGLLTIASGLVVIVRMPETAPQR